MERPLISVVVTVLNEERHLRHLLESLTVQEPPFEVIVVDAGSKDRTVDIAKNFASEYPNYRLVTAPGRRGQSRNVGVQYAKGDYVAFTDGDCIANAFWLKHLRAQAAPDRIVAGRSIQMGYWAFERLERVELHRRGYDITAPSSNLLYPREAFLRLEGFDPRFITAEDIDLNFRAVENGMEILSVPHATVYHRARDSIRSFLAQAMWNGYGRKQLTLKHGKLWSQYKFRQMLQGQLHFWGVLRLLAAMSGYLRCKLEEQTRDWRQPPLSRAQQVPL